MNRQSLIVILIGAIATLSGLWTFDVLRGRRCSELGGTWTQALRECRLAGGETVATATVTSVVLGLLVAAGLGIMLYRAYIFASGRARAASGR